MTKQELQDLGWYEFTGKDDYIHDASSGIDSFLRLQQTVSICVVHLLPEK